MKETFGLSIGEIVFIVLLTLKIVGKIQLCWFLVITSLIWAPLLCIAAIYIIFFVIYGVAGWFQS